MVKSELTSQGMIALTISLPCTTSSLWSVGHLGISRISLSAPRMSNSTSESLESLKSSLRLIPFVNTSFFSWWFDSVSAESLRSFPSLPQSWNKSYHYDYRIMNQTVQKMHGWVEILEDKRVRSRGYGQNFWLGKVDSNLSVVILQDK